MANSIEDVVIQSTDDQTSGQDLSDDQISSIAREIINQKIDEERQGQVYVGKHVDDDWDAELYVNDLYEQMLQACQQEAKLKHRDGQTLNIKTLTFEKYLHLCLESLEYREEHLKTELDRGDIDLPIYNTGKMIAEMSIAAIRKYLERSDTARLIGV